MVRRTRALIADGCLFSDRREAAGLALQFLMPGIAKYPERGELQMRAARVYLRLNNRKAALAALEAAASLLAECAPLAEVREEYVRRSGFWQRLFHR